MILESARFVLLDTSQLVHLCDRREVRRLSAPRFVSEWGLPLISMHNLLELAGIGKYEQVVQRMTMLSSIPTLYTINHSGRPYPGSISDLTATEVEALAKYGSSQRPSIRRFVRERIYGFHLQPTDADIRMIFDKSRELGQKDGFLSAFAASPENPFLKTPLRELQDLGLNSVAPPGLADFAKRFRDRMVSKGLDAPRTEQFVEFFLNQFRSVQKGTPHAISVPEWASQLAQEELDLDKPLGYYLEIYYLKMQLRNTARVTGIPESDLLKKIGWEDVQTLRLSSNLQVALQALQNRDDRRPIELSAMSDIHLATYSLFVDTFVDKRTLDLIQRVNSALNYELFVRRVSYDIP